MMGSLLFRGMLAGLLAGLMSFVFLKTCGEPSVERSIAFEAWMDEAEAKVRADEALARGVAFTEEDPEPELVSRATQAGLGLFSGVLFYSTGVGGLFAIVFALAYGRLSSLGSRGTAALLAAFGFLAIFMVPGIKYPPNPPSVGDPSTIQLRTGTYFAVMAMSLLAMIAAGALHARLVHTWGAWNATIMSGLAYVMGSGIIEALMPAVNEVPDQFPAVTLWSFRVASIGGQVAMWTTLGLVFGVLAERVMEDAKPGTMGRHQRFAAAVNKLESQAR